MNMDRRVLSTICCSLPNCTYPILTSAFLLRVKRDINSPNFFWQWRVLIRLHATTMLFEELVHMGMIKLLSFFWIAVKLIQLHTMTLLLDLLVVLVISKLLNFF